MYVNHSVMSDSLQTPWTVACQAPLSMGENTGVGCHALLPGDLSDPGTEPTSLMSPSLAGRFFTTRANRKHILLY